MVFIGTWEHKKVKKSKTENATKIPKRKINDRLSQKSTRAHEKKTVQWFLVAWSFGTGKNNY